MHNPNISFRTSLGKIGSMTLLSVFFTSFLLLTCKAPARRPNEVKPPNLRIGILEQRQDIEFKIDGPVSFRGKNGDFAIRGAQGKRWRVEAVDSKPARIKYRLAVGNTKDRIKAEDIVRFLDNKGLRVRIVKYDRPSSLSIRYTEDAVYQVVLNKEFETEKDAKVYQIAIQEKTGSEIIEVPVGKAEGTLRFTNLDSKYSFDSKEPVKLTANQVEILDVDVGSGFHWEKSEHRKYGRTLEFLVDTHGLITVVNELPLEEYLKGVVPSEMPVSFPLEALKAQAIAARVEAISKTGLRHPLETFDLCDDVHCQVFSGNSNQAKSSERAVESTRGIFMVYHNKIVEAFYAGLCGGHTENNENVWLMDAKPYLRGILDSGGRNAKRLSSSLQNSRTVRKWIDSGPDVFCNTVRRDAPKALNYSKKYFRWKVAYKRIELQEIIREKTGEDFGQLVDLIPISRGVSGRVKELEVVGTKKRFTISRELPIRQALARKTLFSSCFYVEKSNVSRELASNFVLKGAGWGHGVGMCQIGAAVMAHSGRKFDDILTHYYRGVILEVLYN
ncbi:SpoIID/LytB domain-containing protein [candidate division KSB1 bacterium]|nr:SpoIID/LytB domain-containing protein [candidate division KSB1 bacterium]NIR71706.1 SpoIID/LytB domain-containing protein [candidate division KSB1 bacterium]NIS28253.1 SpoIID/LytB domain-containing protein [candidate division KSB1 bacterium]NIT70383.1 SpoIID/LytB domain-containing protein [candidate division KSB1 bacterium]NIU28930.1 SpoIID/LytB domain-containing protein [candidate division KSB1 bacterium]